MWASSGFARLRTPGLLQEWQGIASPAISGSYSLMSLQFSHLYGTGSRFRSFVNSSTLDWSSLIKALTLRQDACGRILQSFEAVVLGADLSEFGGDLL